MAGTRGRNFSARAAAAKAISEVDVSKPNTAEVLGRYISWSDNHALVTELVFGTVRNMGLIDLLIEKVSGRGTGGVDKMSLAVLRTGFYEYLYVAQSPSYAVINEAVNTAKQLGRSKSSGFVNAVMRNLQRLIVSCLDGSDARPSVDVIITSPGTGVQLTDKILPDPGQKGGQYLAAVFSLPVFLAEEWVNEYGFEKALNICLASNRRPGVYVWPNVKNTTYKELANLLEKESVALEVYEKEGAIKLEGHRNTADLPGYEQGLFYVQDPTAHKALAVLIEQLMGNGDKGLKVLDMCAAPGTKTVQLAAELGDKCTVYATDKNAGRLAKVEENIARLGLRNVRVIPYEAVSTENTQLNRLDAVLADVPCSNTGVLARRVESRFRLSKSGIGKITVLQKQILEKACTLVKPGGLLYYSTCSICKEENSGVVEGFVRDNTDFSIINEVLTLPQWSSPNSDGGYFSLIQRKVL